jgi:hypothetical protein
MPGFLSIKHYGGRSIAVAVRAAVHHRPGDHWRRLIHHGGRRRGIHHGRRWRIVGGSRCYRRANQASYSACDDGACNPVSATPVAAAAMPAATSVVPATIPAMMPTAIMTPAIVCRCSKRCGYNSCYSQSNQHPFAYITFGHDTPPLVRLHSRVGRLNAY